MITKITAENSSRYDVLFDSIGKHLTDIATGEIEAPSDQNSEEYEIYTKWNRIIDEIKASGAEDIYFEKEEGTDQITKVKIESLEAYFGIIKNLIDINPEYGIIPLDEPYFEINANTREIKPPPNFSVQVAGDESAETIFFKIDRYYDIWDLYHDDINIVIQWENAKGEKGISEPWIKLLDSNSEDDYIIFGWAITSTVQSSLSGIAAAPGRATFSIKFYKQGDDNSITYCLNTLPARLSISSGLSIDLNDDALIKEKNMKDIMLERFSNGLVKGVTPPPEPSIVWQNIIEGNTYIDVGSEHKELIVIASTPSAGTLSHKWFKYNENDNRWEQCTNKSPGGYVTGERELKHEISDLSKLPENFFSTYMIYAKPDLETRITDITEIEEYSKEGNAIVYLRGYYLQVTSPGRYYCSVINHKGLLNTSQLSDIATFPNPLTPSVPQEIKSVGYVTDKDISLTPSITLPTEEVNCPKTYAYTWFYKENENDEISELENNTNTPGTLILNTTNSADNKAPEGYYLCQVFHSVNNAQTPTSEAPYQTWRVVSAKDLRITADYSLYEFNNNDKEITEGNIISTESNNKFNLYSLEDGIIELTVDNYDDKYDTIYYAADENLEVSDKTSWNISNDKIIKIDFELGKWRYIHIKKLIGEGEYISTSPVFSIGILAINSGE